MTAGLIVETCGFFMPKKQEGGERLDGDCIWFQAEARLERFF
jgi:hypothetical protein